MSDEKKVHNLELERAARLPMLDEYAKTAMDLTERYLNQLTAMGQTDLCGFFPVAGRCFKVSVTEEKDEEQGMADIEKCRKCHSEGYDGCQCYSPDGADEPMTGAMKAAMKYVEELDFIMDENRRIAGNGFLAGHASRDAEIEELRGLVSDAKALIEHAQAYIHGDTPDHYDWLARWEKVK